MRRDEARGTRIKALRGQAQRSQKAMAELAGVTERAYQEWEYGGAIDEPNLNTLARLLETSPAMILYGEDDGQPADPVAALEQRMRGVERAIGAVDQLAEQMRFVTANRERITRLEESVDASRRELHEVREMVAELGQALLPVAAQMLSVEADRRSHAGSPPLGAERRASAGRRQTDPPTG